MINALFSQNLAYEQLKDHIAPLSKVTVIPFSFGDIDGEAFASSTISRKGKYHRLFIETFEPFGIDKGHISILNYFSDSHDEMLNKINSSDILFFTGGSVEKTLERIAKKNLSQAILSYNKTIIGMSAGALIQLKECFYFEEKEDSSPCFLNGLGLIENDFYIKVHYERENKKQHEVLKQIAKEKCRTIYAIDDNSCIIADNGELKLKGDVTVIVG